MEEKSFKPFISADRVLPEITPVSIGLGILLAVLFGAANAYLGLRVGMTVSASIPAAVLDNRCYFPLCGFAWSCVHGSSPLSSHR